MVAALRIGVSAAMLFYFDDWAAKKSCQDHHLSPKDQRQGTQKDIPKFHQS
jgi:hypothetical protein